MRLKLTLVGGGTTGIEIGKSLGLMGVGSQNGRISILDQDIVKANNIKTHFYFNKTNIGMNKAEIVKSEMLKLNSKLNVQSYKQIIGLKMYQSNDQHNQQNYKEWEESDYILGALNKKRPTNFLIAKCIQSQQKLIISNAYNFKCQFQMIIPGKKYDLDQRDTLYGISNHKEQETQRDVVMIPFLQEQLIQWAHQLFQSIFDNTQKLFKQIKQNKLQQLLIDDLRNDLESRVKILIVKKILDNNYQLNNQQKINFGIELFHYLFVNQIEELIQKYPQDCLTKDGQQFWSGYRRFPTLLEYDITDESFVNFVGSCVNMLSIILDQENNIIQDKQNLIHLIKMQYLVLQNNEYEWNFIDFTQQQMEEILTEIQNLKINADSQEKIKTKQINLDENLLHKNQFLDFMTSATNLKAKCFYLQEIPRYKMEKITFNMNNNVILVHSYIASHTIFQLFRMLQNQYLKSGEFSMIDNTNTCSNQQEDTKQWQQVVIDEQITIQQILQKYCEDQKVFLMNLEDVNIYNHNEKIDYLTIDNQNLSPNDLFYKLTGINIFEQKDHLIITLITRDQVQNTKYHPIYKYLKQ